MKPWPDSDGSAIALYLGQLRLRTRQARNTYRSVLRRFQDAMVRHRCSSSVSREALEAWLCERAAHRPVRMVLHHVRIVDRFLDFLVKEGSIVGNPLAELRAEYGVRSSKPIAGRCWRRNPIRRSKRCASFRPSAASWVA